MMMMSYQFIRPVASGVIQLVTFLIDVMKCDVTTAKSKSGLTCVIQACASGNLDLVKLLIKHTNCNPSVRPNSARSSGFGTSYEAAAVMLEMFMYLNGSDKTYYIVAYVKDIILPSSAAQIQSSVLFKTFD